MGTFKEGDKVTGLEYSSFARGYVDDRRMTESEFGIVRNGTSDSNVQVWNHDKSYWFPYHAKDLKPYRKTKFKVGDKVEKVGLFEYGIYTIAKATKIGGRDTYSLTDGDLGSGTSRHWWHNEDLELFKKENKMATITKNFKVGDIITDKNDKYAEYMKILAVTDYGYVTTYPVSDVEDLDENDVDETLLMIESQEDYTTTDGSLEYTLEEIAEQIGVDVKRLRIKD